MKIIIISYLALVTAGYSFLYQDTTLESSMKRGEELYSDFCVTCHMANGEGVANVFPPLAQSDYLAQNRAESIQGVKFGQSGKIVVNGITYDNVMVAPGLEDEEIADVMNYIMNSWGNSSEKIVSPEEVAGIDPK
jgi:mono/diheme cytochrome c family protein